MAENMTNTTATEESVMTKDIFKKTFWRSFPLQACFCYERMQNVGFAYQMVPALKKLYPNKEEASEALFLQSRHRYFQNFRLPELG